jgi:hypothetical protein
MAEQEVVKPEATESTPEAKPTETAQVETSVKDDGADRPIPYARFKEKVTEVKDLKKQVEKVAAEKEQYAAQVAQQYQTYYESEIAKLKRNIEASQQYTPDYTAPVQDERVGAIGQELTALRQDLARMKEEAEINKLQNQVGNLKPIYPEMDEEHVFAIKKLKPDWSLDECAEYSHKHFEGKINSRVRDMIEKKKEAAKRPVFGDGSKINLKPEERPKNFKDARKSLAAHLSKYNED